MVKGKEVSMNQCKVRIYEAKVLSKTNKTKQTKALDYQLCTTWMEGTRRINLLKQDHVQQIAKDHVQAAFGNLQGRDRTASMPVPCTGSLAPEQYRSAAWCSDATSCISICAHCLCFQH